jgi:hypothetical protein
VYNGVAPDAKVSFIGGMDWDDKVPGIINETKSFVSTNGWGAGGAQDLAFDSRYNRYALEFSDLLVLFAAGNDGDPGAHTADGFHTMRSPAGGKNLLCVGALSQLHVTAVPYGQSGHYRLAAVALKPGDQAFQVDAVCAANSNCQFLQAILGELLAVNPEPEREVPLVVAQTDADLQEVMGTMDDDSVVVVVTAVAFESVTQAAVLCVDAGDNLAWERLKATGNGQNFQVHLPWVVDDGRDTVAGFSSKGPGIDGILKPEVVAPGTQILSARSELKEEANHDDRSPPDVANMQGTSMACSNAAGVAALLMEYFEKEKGKGKAVRPSSSLMKAVLINSAEPLREGEKHPNAEAGFGSLNLGTWLPFSDDTSLEMLIADRVSIADEDHLVSSVEVTGTEKDLRITISHLDEVASADAVMPFLADLDLIVVSPKGQAFRGNHRVDNTEEHFSEHERVIVLPDELETGIYEIHVICSAAETVKSVNFAIAAVGQINASNGYLTFKAAETCATGCGTGTCDARTTLCNCSELHAGQSCQQDATVVSTDGDPAVFKLPALGTRYLSLVKPEGVSGQFKFTVKGNDTNVHWHVYHSSTATVHGAPWTYDARCNGTCELPISNVGSERQVLSALLRSNSIYEEEFHVSASAVPGSSETASAGPSSSETASAGPGSSETKSGLSAGAIAGIVVGAVVVVGAIVGVLVFFVRSRGSDGSGLGLADE